MNLGIQTIDTTSLDVSYVPSYVLQKNKKDNQRALKAIFLTSLLLTLGGIPVLVYASVPVLQMMQPLASVSSTLDTITIPSTGQFLWYYFTYRRFPSRSDWYAFIVQFGLGAAATIGIASALAKVGLITKAVATAVISGYVGWALAIAIAGAVVAY
jgi:hypothetical protein